MKVPYSYLDKQFVGREDLIDEIRALVKTGQFTLGPAVERFEENFAKFCGVKYAIGMNSGTDALIMILRALGIGPGDEVITVPNSFFATAAAIDVVGAKVVFVDVNDEYLMDPEKLEGAINSKTKAIMPVQWGGNMADMPAICKIAKKYGLYVIEDAAQAVDADINGKKAGAWGYAAGFSFHPLKNLNGWGDGGMVTTNDKKLAEKLKLLRNHGLKDRDHCEFFAYNCRLHSIQAVLLNKLLEDIVLISDKRIVNANLYYELLSGVDGVTLPPRRENVRRIYHTFIIQVEKRDELVKFLEANEIEVKVHYPIPLHLQKAARHLGYKKGDFPNCEKQAKRIMTLPVHQFLTQDQIFFVAEKIKEFYSKI